MWSGRALRRKKTNLAQSLSNAYTMNAPGVYPVPYGANGVLIGGRGSPGNPSNGGNVSSQGNRIILYSGYSYTMYHDETLSLELGKPMYSFSTGDRPWSYSNTPSSPSFYTANYQPVSGYRPGLSQVWYHVTATHPTNSYNPTYYNPSYPGNPGASTNFGGVTFPGGSGGSTAPLVAPTLSPFKYVQGGISVTVPPGGQVTLTPIDK